MNRVFFLLSYGINYGTWKRRKNAAIRIRRYFRKWRQNELFKHKGKIWLGIYHEQQDGSFIRWIGNIFFLYWFSNEMHIHDSRNHSSLLNFFLFISEPPIPCCDSIKRKMDCSSPQSVFVGIESVQVTPIQLDYITGIKRWEIYFCALFMYERFIREEFPANN